MKCFHYSYLPIICYIFWRINPTKPFICNSPGRCNTYISTACPDVSGAEALLYTTFVNILFEKIYSTTFTKKQKDCMKKIFVLTILLALVSTSFGQQITPNQHWTESDYYKKSRKQKTAAWILTGTGTAGLLVTFAADAGQTTTEVLTTVFSGGTVEPEYKSLTVPYLLSTACVLSGIYLFIASSKNKKKAKAASVFIDIENAPILQGTVFNNQSFPALGVKIHL